MLVAVVDYGGITRVAKRMHMAQSAVSQAILRLEHELQLPLLFRLPGSGGVRPTEAGLALAAHARAILKSVVRAEEEMKEFRGLSKGTVNLGILSTASWFLLAPLLRRLRQQHPGLQVRVFEAIGHSVLEQLRLGLVDLAIVFLPILTEGLIVSEFGSFELYLVMPPDHPLSGQSQVPLADLADEPWVSFAEDPGRAWLEQAFQATGRQPRVAVEASSVTQIKIFVEAGAGLALLPLPSVATDVLARRLHAVGIVPPLFVSVGCASVSAPGNQALVTVQKALEQVVGELSWVTPAFFATGGEP
ncbi:MAG: LysR family transcriptional regulator [Candidatus Dormibacteraceae bacterium]